MTLSIDPKFLTPLLLVTPSLQSFGVTTILYEPSSYFSEVDSPFYQGIVDNTGDGIWLEDFEDQELNTPYVSQPTNEIFIGNTFRSRFPDVQDGIVHSVDGDDGSVDGMAFLGDSWITRNKVTNGGSNRVRFDFSPDHLGRLPLYVGIVVTEPADFSEDVEFIPFGPNNQSIALNNEFDPLEWGPPGFVDGSSPQLHQFIGIYHSEGISSLRLFNVSQVDHLQYGYSIPEPGSIFLLSLSILGLALQRRRSPSSSANP